MTIEEIYSKISAHMIEGMMTHEGLANYYDFLGLHGFKRVSEYYYIGETINHRRLNRYFINHHGKLIPEERVDNPVVIPESWYKYRREDVDTQTKRNAVKAGIERWVTWERETKTFLEEMCNQLYSIDAVADSIYIKSFICDVDKELKKAERCWIKMLSCNYDIIYILDLQDELHEKYKKKMPCEIEE